ncbi:COMPASS component SWD1 [Fistulifera solaris]|uniref:COMPASS component SWD1 n=1 Tax=Fistulifera solaris TaxID=1519565 RepID=A0A1Z5J917_FISSO|nr:COMPASS component SWD1 [Fistulifera solaris]|eukprot:GAX10261.1 COMPASS component SWD1 [Fistulifera solaris]
MNLELLDPFARQVPDRVHATLDLPGPMHFRNHHEAKEEKNAKIFVENTEWKSVYHLAFNRRGTYIAAGYGSGAVAVFNVLNRTISALYPNQSLDASPESHGLGISSVSWSKRSRTLLTGSLGDFVIRMFDTTHPLGPEEGCTVLQSEDTKESDEEAHQHLLKEGNTKDERVCTHSFDQTKSTGFRDIDRRFDFVKEDRQMALRVFNPGDEIQPKCLPPEFFPSDAVSMKRFPSISFSLPHKVGGSLQVHPRVTTAGLVVLENGSLCIFYIHPSTWLQWGDPYKVQEPVLISIANGDKHHITCAAFGPHGDRIYAATKNGRVLGFDVSKLLDRFTSKNTDAKVIPMISAHFDIAISGAQTSWHLIASRNGKFFVINSADGVLRLFSTDECWDRPEAVIKPMRTFQDVVSKVKFASFDLSGDGEFIVGGANGADHKYQLYVWNSSTGVLMDKLIGPSVQLYSVAWHPARSFIAAATSDGLIDIWGQRFDFTNFAPDFQSLPRNVEYIEEEGELDKDEKDKYIVMQGDQLYVSENAKDKCIDIISIEAVPVFASDSENEEEVFAFETKIKNSMQSE